MKMKKITVWLSIVLCFLTLAGCSRTETGESSVRADGTSEENRASGGTETPEGTQPPQLTGEYVPIAEFAKAPFIVFEFGYQYIYQGDEIICQGGEDEDRLLAYACDGTNTSRVLAEADCGEASHIGAFFIDREGSLYLYEDVFLSPDESACYLRKIDKEGHEAYRVNFAEEDIISCVIYVDQNGNAVLIDQMEWEIYFFDSEGSYLGRESVPYEDGGRGKHAPMVHTGKNDLICIEGQYFLWRVEEGDGFISLWEVDFENCHISKEKIIDMTSFGDAEYKTAHAGRGSRFDGLLFDGGPLGLLISTEDVLWQYDMDTGISTELLRWDERHISIDGRCVWQLDTGKANEGGTDLEVMVYNDIRPSYTYATPEIANITYIDKAYIKESQVVSIGLSSTTGGIEQTIRRFNRLNNGYEAVLVDYDADMLKDMLSYGKEIPDLLDVTTIRTEWLENKNLLEDLTSYFETSSTIGKEDILPAVWELLEGDDGKLTCMATGFRIRALTTASDLPEDGWTYSRLLSLENEYPGSLYMDQYTPAWVWDLISMTAVDDFIDWDTHRCSFDSPEFSSLIEGVKNLDYPERRRPGNSANILERMVDGQILMRYSSYGAPYDYEREQAESSGALRTISFPTADGEPTYLFAAGQSLAIYGASPNKDGAWAFLEFLLTEAEQNWFGSNRQMFPVNADAFNEYLSRSYGPRGRTYIKAPEGGNQNLLDLIAAQTLIENPASEETMEKMRDMVSHLALNQNTADEISSIIKEELQAYFAGDKTVEQTTAIIQNRVQLYLDEL